MVPSVGEKALDWDVLNPDEKYNPYENLDYIDLAKLRDVLEIHYEIGADFEKVVALYLDKSIADHQAWNFKIDNVERNLYLDRYYLLNAHPDFIEIAKRMNVDFKIPDFIGLFSSGNYKYLVPLDAKYSPDGRNSSQLKVEVTANVLSVLGKELGLDEDLSKHRIIPGKIITQRNKSNEKFIKFAPKSYLDRLVMIDLPALGIDESNLKTMYYLADLFNISFEDEIFFQDKQEKQIFGRDILYFLAEALNTILDGKDIETIRAYIELENFSLVGLIQHITREKEIERLNYKVGHISIRTSLITFLKPVFIDERDLSFLSDLISAKLKQYFYDGKIPFINLVTVRRNVIKNFSSEYKSMISDVGNNIDLWSRNIELCLDEYIKSMGPIK